MSAPSFSIPYLMSFVTEGKVKHVNDETPLFKLKPFKVNPVADKVMHVYDETPLFKLKHKMATYTNETHKIVTAEYVDRDWLYCVPRDWDLEDIEIRSGEFYYKGWFQKLPGCKVTTTRPENITEDLDSDINDYFDTDFFGLEE